MPPVRPGVSSLLGSKLMQGFTMCAESCAACDHQVVGEAVCAWEAKWASDEALRLPTRPSRCL